MINQVHLWKDPFDHRCAKLIGMVFSEQLHLSDHFLKVKRHSDRIEVINW